MDRRLPRNVIKSHGVKGKGAKAKDGGWGGTTGKKGAPEKLGEIGSRLRRKRYQNFDMYIDFDSPLLLMSKRG